VPGTPLDCDDNNSCTIDSCNIAEGQCVHDPLPLQGTSCDDGAYCTVNDVCAAGGACTGTARNCADTNSCTADSCDEAANRCVHDPAPLQGSGCDDGLYCTVGDACHDGTCAGAARNCADTNLCTTDACDEPGQRCVHTPIQEGGSCDDGLFCTVNEICTAGVCAGMPRDCTDTSACTADSCDETGHRCINDPAPFEGTACSDGNACTEGDHCSAGNCVAAPLDCNDNIPCTVDTCDQTSGCQHRAGPGAGCLIPERSILVVRESTSVAKNKIVWKWLKGPADIAGFGDPSVSTDYALCVYDLSNGGTIPRLAMESSVVSGAKWHKLGGGASIIFRYKEADASGQRKVLLKALSNNTGRIGFKSKGDRTTAPSPVGTTLFADDDAVVVQLISSEGKCWESRFAAPAVKQRASSFKDKCGDLIRGPCN
jgi:hypothetical protein